MGSMNVDWGVTRKYGVVLVEGGSGETASWARGLTICLDVTRWMSIGDLHILGLTYLGTGMLARFMTAELTSLEKSSFMFSEK